ncbi:MAG: hypothetical protein M1526_06920 [Candidatus Thermoplasmatota archaeon]|jgi:Arc/MetJ-type ribon-helix-helix transcriptional regulator|nr:hypothetical protein [Candidatus Thermoplasmatota archaeon]MCL5680446.1 hypothetical protein [Candidatus Thermoplasmatota archaeon]
MKESGTRRIALRLTRQEDDEVNDFLSSTLRFKTKSELIRAAIYAYIRKPEEIQTAAENQQYKLSKASLKLLDQMVLKGIAIDRDDAIEKIIQISNYERVIPQWISKEERAYMDNFNTLNLNDIPTPPDDKRKNRGESNDREFR